MKTIGIITDTHANLPALEAALSALGEAGCDEIIHTGDTIALGPHPGECLDRLLHTPNIRFIMGNHDQDFVTGLPNSRPERMGEDEWQHECWTQAQLDPALREIVATWPYQLELNLGPLTISACHYPLLPDSSTIFAPIQFKPNVPSMDDLFAQFESEVIFYGHSHITSDIIGRARYVNPGALGMGNTAEAKFAILIVNDDDSWAIHLDSVPYDRDQVIRDFEARNVPDREFVLHIMQGGTF